MAKGDGSIVEKKDPKTGRSYSPKRWSITISYGFNAVTGKRNRHKETFHGTKTEARKRRDELNAMLGYGIRLDAQSITFAEYSKEWHDRRVSRGELSETTFTENQKDLRYLCEVIGDCRLCDLKPAVIDDAMGIIKNSHPGANGNGLSGTTMRRTFTTLSSVLKCAVRDELIVRNPCDLVKPPKIDTEEKKPLSEAELLRLLDCVSESVAAELDAMRGKEARMNKAGKRFDRSAVRGVSRLSYLTAVRIAAFTGMRKGEVLGLRWCDVEADLSALNVRHSLTKNGALKEPKTKKSRRSVQAPPTLSHMLGSWRAIQFTCLRSLGITDFQTVPVCCSDAGGFVGYANFDRWFRGWKAERGFQGVGMHCFRHTWITIANKNGVDQRTIQGNGGHADGRMMGVYLHETDGSARRAADLMDSVIGERKAS